jgi:hypothetical protein
MLRVFFERFSRKKEVQKYIFFGFRLHLPTEKYVK